MCTGVSVCAQGHNKNGVWLCVYVWQTERERKREWAEGWLSVQHCHYSLSMLNGVSLCIGVTELACENGKGSHTEKLYVSRKAQRIRNTNFKEWAYNGPSENSFNQISECVMLLMCAAAEPGITFLFLHCLNLDVSNSRRSCCTVTQCLCHVPPQSRWLLLV